jgi:hypothetical protein
LYLISLYDTMPLHALKAPPFPVAVLELMVPFETVPVQDHRAPPSWLAVFPEIVQKLRAPVHPLSAPPFPVEPYAKFELIVQLVKLAPQESAPPPPPVVAAFDWIVVPLTAALHW